MKIQIEVHVPENFDAENDLRRITYAMGNKRNVSQQELILVNDLLSKIEESLDAAKPKMKKFNVIYYGVVEALNKSDAEIIADGFSPIDKKCIISGYEGSYKYVSNEVHDCVPEDTQATNYVVDGYYNYAPFSVFYNQTMMFTERALNEAIIPDNPKSFITITKIHK